ncbi:MAG: 5'-nucleotidase C-terminal domain-containing protein [Bacteroidales bacterium]|nr:5'-nucleotidase C-terminal domain-containing protein [Bacteroidales bacterium]
MRSPFLPLIFASLLTLVSSSCQRSDETVAVILGTTDIHGTFFPFDFINNEEASYSLASVATYVKEVRNEGFNTVLLDNGDILQGQPEVYYYNFIDTVSPHLCAEMMNLIGYDAATAGNHDIEAGHQVYDRITREYNFPMLAANAVSTATGEPYFKPYAIIKRGKLKIAVLGLITPSVPTWIPPVLYSGMKFENMTETAAIWMEEIKSRKPDIIIGLFHSGWDDDAEAPLPGNSSNAVVYNVPGFDVVFTGHDHSRMNSKIVNIAGDTVVVINAGSRAANIARVDVIKVSNRSEGDPRFRFEGTLVETETIAADPEFVETFSPQFNEVSEFVTRKIALAPEEISSRDAVFGPSGFTSMIHTVQIDLTGADISFAAPLSFDVSIGPGQVTVADMFKLYRYENMLYTMNLTGNEIDGFLEHSCSGWFNTYSPADRYILNYRKDDQGKPVITGGKARLSQPVYNFDSAAGIDYTVDVMKEAGNRVEILRLSDGRKFHADSIYSVAINSYRGSGGGGHIRFGARLSPEEALVRLVKSTERDLRFYMIDWIEKRGELVPEKHNNWKLVPEWVVTPAIRKEWALIYGE